MDETIRHDLELAGCAPQPLIAYLKALAVLRVVSKQKDSEARGWWKNDVFWLRSSLDRDGLVKLFLEEYEPTPIVVPWSGGDFFGVNWRRGQVKHSKTPTSSKAIEAVLGTKTPRLERYRAALQMCKAVLQKCGIDTKEKMGKQKWTFIQALRSICPDQRLVEWIDAAAVGTVERFAPLLGSGGGSDGNTHFSDNFMQNLWDMLPDFDNQRKQQPGALALSTTDSSRDLLRSALFKSGTNRMIEKRTSSLYDSGAVGGPNATQGMERDSISNSWDVILGLEGTVCFAGAAAKRLAAGASSDAVFPFQVTASVTLSDRMAGKEQAGKEIWLPVWSRPTQSEEVLMLLREGRAQCGPRTAASGVDMARALATLGIDRGIPAFHRYAIVKGRVGGDNYNTAASLGRFHVCERPEADLLYQLDGWLDSFRRAASDKNAPARFGAVLRGIDSAVIDFCRYGGKPLFQKILIALGRAERELALTEGKVGNRMSKPRPLTALSTSWIASASDNSHEFGIALALAGIHDRPVSRGDQPRIGPLRVNLEPVDWRSHCRAWAEKDRSVVWNSADVPTNLANVLQRRMMDADRAGCERLPLASRYTVPLKAIAAFIADELDDRRVEELIWGLMLVGLRRDSSQATIKFPDVAEAPPLPRDYALLKLLFLPRPLVASRHDGTLHWRLAKGGESGLAIRHEPRILALLRAGRVAEACRIAAQRLRVSGLPSMPGPLPIGTLRDETWAERAIDHRSAQRLAAALLIPISSRSVNHLVHLVCRADDSAAAEALALAAEGETE